MDIENLICTVGTSLFGVDVSPDGKYIYVTDNGANQLLVIDQANPSTAKASISTGPGPKGVAVAPSGNIIAVANSDDDTVSLINAANNTVITSIYTGTPPVEEPIGDGGDNQDYNDFEALDAENPLFNYHHAVPIHKLPDLLKKYDYGWYCLDYRNITHDPRYFETGLGSRLFTYMAAELPVIISAEHRHMAELIGEHQIGFSLQYDDEKEAQTSLFF